ncbi:4'-phosphopantetheinyl transferase superfamily protein [Achromobacter sp. UMC46]|uniref:4'-phosphopantetheinyl transferase family protein n=1 Tax=Achromobacter sp. UMC46 TaxID=1862319 RepID=UPI001C81A95E|nr:4'-phosphopantetheinyl transferase superfamily protein [Achromobacter sp. UMC46]
MYWADQSAAVLYQEKDLSAEDVHRAPGSGSRQARRDDWQVSRALLHEARRSMAPGAVLSLSHSGGHAVCAQAPAGWRLGADLERMRARDVPRLAAWICSPAEAAALAALEGAAQLARFYLLWTLKEAFIKAAGLDFPADMASVGLMPDARGGWRLNAPAGAWRACSWRVGDAWMASMVWLAPSDNAMSPQWRTVAACPLPPVTLIGHWQSAGA